MNIRPSNYLRWLHHCLHEYVPPPPPPIIEFATPLLFFTNFKSDGQELLGMNSIFSN